MRDRIAALALALCAPSCRDDAGDACAEHGVACAAADRLIVCDKTAQTSYPCRGPRGCIVREGTAECDTRGNAAGDACRPVDAPRCAGSNLVACDKGSTTIRSCSGPTGCKPGDPPACDQTIASDGAGCDDAAAIACRDDGKALVVCREGRFTLEARCERGCRVASDAPVCAGARLDLDRLLAEELPRAMRSRPREVASALRGGDVKAAEEPPTKIRLRVGDRRWLIDVDARGISKAGEHDLKATQADCTVSFSVAALELLLLRPELATPLFFSGRMRVEGNQRCVVVLPKLLALRPWPPALLPPTEALSDVPLPP